MKYLSQQIQFSQSLDQFSTFTEVKKLYLATCELVLMVLLHLQREHF